MKDGASAIRGVRLSTESPIIELTDGRDAVTRLHPLWLRDNCSCPVCRHPVTGERLLFTGAIAPDIRPQEIQITETGDLAVAWPEEGGAHRSVYPGEWLRGAATGGGGSTLLPAGAIPWTAETFERVRIPWREVMADNAAVLAWAEAMVAHGVATIEGVPNAHGEVERLASRLAHVRETAYDRLHEVRSEPDPYNVASTPVELKTHTDMPNYLCPPGVQLLHFMENGAIGGETTLADGFAVAAEMARTAPTQFELLCRTPVSFRMTSKKADIIGTSRLITLGAEGALEIVRFSNQLMQPLRLPIEALDAFYEAYQAYSRAMVSPTNVVQFRSAPGTVVTTHNHRVLHGRAAFDSQSGPRRLQLSYLDFDDVLSWARIIRQSVAAA